MSSSKPPSHQSVFANPNYIPQRLRTLDPLTLIDKPVPERSWLVENWIPDRNVTMLGGDGGLGKSLLAMQLMTAAAIGRDWLGLGVKPCKALGLFCEDDEDEIHRRQAAINEHYGIGFGDLENLNWVVRPEQDSALVEFDREDRWINTDKLKPTEFFQRFHDACQDFGAQLIVVDSLHDVFQGNENARGQARQFIHLLRGLAHDCEACVIVAAHPSLTGLTSGSGFSGSTAWNNAVRSRLYLTIPEYDEDEDPDPDARVLARKKSNYSGRNDSLNLRWSEGVFENVQEPAGVFKSIHQRSVEQVFIDCLAAVTRQGRYVSDSRRGNYAPKAFCRMPEAQGHRMRDLARAMESLFDAGTIIMGEVKGPDRHKRIGIVQAKQHVANDTPQDEGEFGF